MVINSLAFVHLCSSLSPSFPVHVHSWLLSLTPCSYWDTTLAPLPAASSAPHPFACESDWLFLLLHASWVLAEEGLRWFQQHHCLVQWLMLQCPLATRCSNCVKRLAQPLPPGMQHARFNLDVGTWSVQLKPLESNASSLYQTSVEQSDFQRLILQSNYAFHRGSKRQVLNTRATSLPNFKFLPHNM